jgi:hypothetical protein
VAAALIGTGVGMYRKARARAGKYVSTRDICKQIDQRQQQMDKRQQLILNTQIASVQEVFCRASGYWSGKGYINDREKRALKKLYITYEAAGGNDLVGHFWDTIDSLPIKGRENGHLTPQSR